MGRHCAWYPLPDGGMMHVMYGSSRQPRCRFCKRLADFECDGWKDGGGTCDAPMCAAHRTRTPGQRDLCPDCAKAVTV
jgi:hypothetical protein